MHSTDIVYQFTKKQATALLAVLIHALHTKDLKLASCLSFELTFSISSCDPFAYIYHGNATKKRFPLILGL